LEENDDLVAVRLVGALDRAMLVTARGQSIMFPITDARSMGRATRGVRGIRLREADLVVAMDVIRSKVAATDEAELEALSDESELDPNEELITDDDAALEEIDESEVEEEIDEDDTEETSVDDATPTVLLITENGYGKRTPLERFRIQRRGGLGLRALPYVERNGALMDMCRVQGDQDLMVVTNGGTIIRLPIAEVRVYSRQAKGVRIIALNEGEKVVSIHPVEASEEEEELEGVETTDDNADLGEELADAEEVDDAFEQSESPEEPSDAPTVPEE